MANRVKEDEKNERIIRNLLKLPDNRCCINCNSRGPQYVCTNFWTFICTTCSGIHREFTHRVKSVSMAKFTSQEVSALEAGGNARAKEIYFKEWDSQRSVPDSSNVERLRDFIKHVYVDRRYTGDKSFDKPPRMKMGEAEDTYENRRDTYEGGSRSPPYEDAYERRYSDRPSPGGRSPGYDQESRQYGDFRRSPARNEIVNDWRREDRFGNGRKSDDSRISDGSSKLGGRSPDHQKDPDMSSPPVVRPVREILGENVSPLRIIEPPKHTGGRAIDGSVHTQRTASSSSLASSNGNAAEAKVESLGTLIDFDTVPEPPKSGAVLQTPSAATGQSVAQPTPSPSADNWANFDSALAEVKVTQASSKANSLESVLSELTVPASVPAQSAMPGQMSIFPSGNNSAPAATPVNNLTMFPPVNAAVLAPVGQMSASPFGVDVGAPAVATTNIPTFPSSGVPAAAAGLTSVLPSNNVDSVAKVPNGGQWPTLLSHQQSLFPAAGSQATAQPFAPAVSGHPSSQPWNSSLTPNAPGTSTMPVAPASQSVLRPAADVTPGVVKQSLPPEVKPSGRQALPEDLFTARYPSSVPLPGWQSGPAHGFGFNMQYNAVPMQTFTQSSRSVNPFDLSNETSQIQAPMFPSMASLQGALPNVAPAQAGLLRTSSLGTPSPTWMPSQLPYSSAMPPQAPSFTSAIPPSAYMGQHIPNNLPPRQQPVGGFGGQGAGFGSLNPSQPHQQLGGIYSAPATPNTFSAVGGNPFG